MTPATLAVYLALLFAIGTYRARHATSASSFFVADRRNSAPLVASSLLATIVGASATLGLAARSFTVGLPATWWLLSGVAGLLLLAGCFAERIQAYGVYTLPGLLAAQYGGQAVKRAASALIVVAWLGVIAAQIGGAATILRQATGGHGAGWTILAALVLISYPALGGQRAVLRTDAWQLGLMLSGFAAGLACALTRVGGWAGLHAAVPPDLLRWPANDAMPPSKVLLWLLAVGLPYAVGPDMVSRLLCAKDRATARRAALLAAAGLIPVAFCMALLGLCARAVAPHIGPAQALPAVLEACLPPWAAGLLAAALLAGLMSSAATCLLTTATILVVELLGTAADQAVTRTRLGVVGVGVLATAVALWHADIIQSLLWAYTIFTGGVVLPVVLGFWRERLQLREASALAAVIVGGAIALAGSLSHRELVPAALLASGAITLLRFDWPLRRPAPPDL